MDGGKKIENPFWRFRDGQLEFLGSGGKRVVSFRFDLKCPQNKFWNTGDTGSEAFNVCLQV